MHNKRLVSCILMHVKSNAIWSSKIDNLLGQLYFSFVTKTIKWEEERERERDSKNMMRVWERELSKSCQFLIVQISFF
jgi:hypothetical protein